MRKILRVGLTGGIGVGKSEALAAFGRAGAETLSLDEVAHRLSGRGKPVFRAIVRSFGAGILDSAGCIDRNRLADKVFRDLRLRQKLERASHPAILREMKRHLKKSRAAVTVVDVPLLFEKRLQKYFDVTLLVTSTLRNQLRRVLRRDRTSKAAVLRRIRVQMDEARKRRLADIELGNNGSLKALHRAVSQTQRAFDLMANKNTRVSP